MLTVQIPTICYYYCIFFLIFYFFITILFRFIYFLHNKKAVDSDSELNMNELITRSLTVYPAPDFEKWILIHLLQVYKFLLSFKFTSVHFHSNSKTKKQHKAIIIMKRKKRYLYYLKALQQEGIKRTRHINPLNKIQCIGTSWQNYRAVRK